MQQVGEHYLEALTLVLQDVLAEVDSSVPSGLGTDQGTSECQPASG